MRRHAQTFGTAPVIETARLRLRPYRVEDLPAACAIWQDEDVVRYIAGEPRSAGRVWSVFQASYGSWAMLGYGYWAVADIETDAFIGEVGFLEALRNIEPGFSGTPEAGWVFGRNAWGKGYAREALTAMFDWFDTRGPGGETACIIDPSNIASVRLAQRLGFRETAQTTYEGNPTVIMKRSGKVRGAHTI